MTTAKDRRLEDFGMREIVGANERLKEYETQSKGLPKTKKAVFWLEVLEQDREVRELVAVQHQVYHKQWGRRR